MRGPGRPGVRVLVTLAPVVQGQLRAPSGISHPQGDFPPPWEIPPPTMEWEFPPPGGLPTPPGNPTTYNMVGVLFYD